MSRLALRQKSGVVAALAALVMGLTAAAALGWANEGNGNKDKEHGNKPPPTVTVPPPTQTTPPPVTQPPPVTPASPPPATSQGTPSTPTTPEKVGGGSTPGGNKDTGETGGPSETPQGPEVAQTPTQAPLAPVAERKELAETGIDPGLIALLGALCLVGGVLLFRRSLARG
jgi:LPXTG-motif cell wall-anchored protein